ncbi:hypothetical protein C8F04DRAFT_1194952 [Mycena alexandri]|uniref:Uncharacterized protein n=1 Tax=Mycena alexandri TaxID=1745969 RepID=A0AAD6S902_9AGAR|nr:hypothetical protein C8F04DRAFT_1194952 [Mycena alexandri]
MAPIMEPRLHSERRLLSPQEKQVQTQQFAERDRQQGNPGPRCIIVQIKLNLQPRLVTVAKYSGENEVEMEGRLEQHSHWRCGSFAREPSISLVAEVGTLVFSVSILPPLIRSCLAGLSEHLLKECCYSPRGPLSTTIGSLVIIVLSFEMRKPRKLTPLSPRFRGQLPLNNGADIRTWKVGVQSIRIRDGGRSASNVRVTIEDLKVFKTVQDSSNNAERRSVEKWGERAGWMGRMEDLCSCGRQLFYSLELRDAQQSFNSTALN